MLDIIKDHPLLQKILLCAAIVLVGMFAVRAVLALVKKALEKSTMEKAAHSLITSLVKAILYLLVGLSAASALDIDVTGVVALASVLTLALSLALQNMVSNVIGGFTILYTHPFHSGDYVEIAGQAGTVQEINTTYTMLTTPDNKLVSIPNSAVVAAQIVNYSSTGTRRVEVNVSASYDAPVQRVLDALLEAAQEEKVLAEPAPAAVVLNYGDSAIAYSLRVWVNTPDYWDVQFALNQKVKSVFDAYGIEMTYPHLNVHLAK